jgi:hypothetical protein
MKGQGYKPPKDAVINLDNMHSGAKVEDAYVENDIKALAELATLKGYDVYEPEDPLSCYMLLSAMESRTNAQTKIIFFFSGEGTKKGLWTKFCKLPDRILTHDAFCVEPDFLLHTLSWIKGKQAIVVSACESGIFADAAREIPEFKGVVLTSCDKGFATTPCETSNHTAFFTSFLNEYKDNPAKVKNLADLNLGVVGEFPTNERHRWVDFWSGSGLPISYASVCYSTTDFPF